MPKRARGRATGGLHEAARALRAGTISEEEFVRRAAPYAVVEVGDVAKLDAGRHARTGVSEAVLAEGKDDAALAAVVRAAVRQSGRCLVTRLTPARGRRLARALPGITVDLHPSAHAAVAHDGRTKKREGGGKVAILTAGTSDLRAALEAKLAAEEQGCTVLLFADVGVAGIHRLFPAVRKIAEERVAAVIVAAGMDGALPSVVGGLVSVPTIGLPVSTGYGVGGRGKAALLSILQSCAPGVAAVNVDNGYGAGVLAAKIARGASRNRGGNRGRRARKAPRQA